MSRKGNCWDNAVAESFFGSLKKERIKKQIYRNREVAAADVPTTSRRSTIGHAATGISEASALRSSKQLTRRGARVSTESWELHSDRVTAEARSAQAISDARVSADSSERWSSAFLIEKRPKEIEQKHLAQVLRNTRQREAPLGHARAGRSFSGGRERT